MRRVYISGPMSGLPESNYPAFNAAAALLRAEGFEVEKPAENTRCDSLEDYMRLALVQIARCDTIALLPGWMRSRGAKIESQLAADLRMDRIFLSLASSTDAACPTVTLIGRSVPLRRTAPTSAVGGAVQA